NDDFVHGNDGSDLIYGNLGNDVIKGLGGADKIFGGQGNDQVEGDAGNDVIYGKFGNDSVQGDAGNDTRYGGQGDDGIRAQGNDQDRLFGNLGHDTFDFATFDQSTTGGVVVDATSDRIADFETGVDKVALKLSVFNDTTPDFFAQSSPSVTTVEQAITAAGNVSGKDVIFVAGANDGFLLINASGGSAISGQNEFAVVLQGKHNLTDFVATDLLFV